MKINVFIITATLMLISTNEVVNSSYLKALDWEGPVEESTGVLTGVSHTGDYYDLSRGVWLNEYTITCLSDPASMCFRHLGEFLWVFDGADGDCSMYCLPGANTPFVDGTVINGINCDGILQPSGQQL